MATPDLPAARHPVSARRATSGWSQVVLAQRAGIPRSSLSAIESGRLIPSVATALALSKALESSVETLFGSERDGQPPLWALPPQNSPCRFWEARIDGRRRLYPAAGCGLVAALHDGVWRGESDSPACSPDADRTLVLACCDPAVGLLATAYARASSFRLLALPFGGAAALDLLSRRHVHVAGLHRATNDQPLRNAEWVRERLGPEYVLLRAARWETGLALPTESRRRTLSAVLRSKPRWAKREAGSGARECLDALLGKRAGDGREVRSHAAVAEAVRSGWAEAGVCVRLAAEEAGLGFLPVQTEALDFCFPESLRSDPRLQALVRLLRSTQHRRTVGELPGYDASETGEFMPLCGTDPL